MEIFKTMGKMVVNLVMGLLQQQSGYINNEEALTAIRNSENRMHSIALIHQKLYQTEQMDLICMPEYIDELVNHVKDSYDLGNRIFFEKTIDVIDLEVTQAVPLGLILSEAITNAIKYAYPGSASGIVQISLIKVANDKYQLIVKDNGYGLPEDFDSKTISSMGLKPY